MLHATKKNPKKPILLTGGIGDVISIESFLTDEERASIDCIYYATGAYKHAREIMSVALPHIKEHIKLSDASKIYFHKWEVDQDFGQFQAEDYSIAIFFPQRRAYNNSSLLKMKLADIDEIKVRYIIICPYSMNNYFNSALKLRNFGRRDWNTCLQCLEEQDLLGIVLHKGTGWIPKHSRLIDLTNKTTLLQSIEYMKRAIGYLGIDSCLSVIAAKLYKNLCVKSINDHAYKWKHVYYAPKVDYSFLMPSMRKVTF